MMKRNSSDLITKYIKRCKYVNALVLFCASVIVSALIACDNARPEYYTWLPLLPLSYGVTVLLCSLINRNAMSSYYVLVPVILYGIRNLITPCIMCFGSYYGSFKLLTEQNVLAALGLMIYETLVVFLCLTMTTNKRRQYVRQAYERQKCTQLFKCIMIVLSVFCFFAYLIVPSIRDAYTSIFSSDGLRAELESNANVNIGSIQRIAFTLFQVLFPIVYMFVCTALIIRINKRNRELSLLRTILLLLVIFIPALFMNGGDGNTLICIVTLFVVAMYVCNNRKHYLVECSIIAVGLVMVYIFVEAMTSTLIHSRVTLGSSLSNMFQAYFPGVCNMAGVFNTNSYDKMKELFYDVYSMIPFRATLFGLTDYISLPNLYTMDNDALSHIMPCVGHVFYYIGLLAPIVPCLLYKWAYKVYLKMKNTSNPYLFMAYTFLFIYLELTPIMYNIVIFGAHYFSNLLPMVILAKMACKSSRKHGNCYKTKCSGGSLTE